MSRRRMGGGGSRGRRIGPMLASGRGGRTGPSPSRKGERGPADPSAPGMQAPLPPRRTPVVPETRRRPPRGMAQGGMMKKKGYAKGGMMMNKKGYAKGGKVRGAGIVTKGVRPAKMVTMKGS